MYSPKNIEKTKIYQFMLWVEEHFNLKFEDYFAFHHWSIENIELFWEALVSFLQIKFHTPAHTILNKYNHIVNATWFEGASFNYAEELLKKKYNKAALITLNENNQSFNFSFEKLKSEVIKAATGLTCLGVKAGEHVSAYMPNVAETIIMFLASASIGAIFSSCSSDFGLDALCDRLGQVQPKILLMADKTQYHGKIYNHIDKIKEIQTKIPSIEYIILTANHKINIKNTILWQDFLKENSSFKFVPFAFNHPLYVLFSSGTTGIPKCIIHGAGGVYLQHLKEHALHVNLSSKDCMLFYTSCGWMMWNWMITSLALGTTLVLYDGAANYPSYNRLFEIIDAKKVSVFGTSAKFLALVEKNNVKIESDIHSLKTILTTGSPLLPASFDYVYNHVKPDVLLSSISGGTDIVSCFVLGNPILPVNRGEIQCLGLGMSVEIFNNAGKSVVDEQGELVCTKPFPSMPLGFLNDPQRKKYKAAYFAKFDNVWTHGDYAKITVNHGVIIYGRSDCVLNPGGVRIGTAEIYRQIEKIPSILDAVVVGQKWENDERIILFVQMKNGFKLNEDLINDIKKYIKTHASPRHVPSKIIAVPDIPKTINQKTLELAVSQVIHNKEVVNLSSIANPQSLDFFRSLEDLKN